LRIVCDFHVFDEFTQIHFHVVFFVDFHIVPFLVVFVFVEVSLFLFGFLLDRVERHALGVFVEVDSGAEFGVGLEFADELLLEALFVDVVGQAFEFEVAFAFLDEEFLDELDTLEVGRVVARGVDDRLADVELLHVVAEHGVALLQDVAQVRLDLVDLALVLKLRDGDPGVHHLLQPLHDFGRALRPGRVLDAQARGRLVLEVALLVLVFERGRHRIHVVHLVGLELNDVVLVAFDFEDHLLAQLAATEAGQELVLDIELLL